MYLYSRNMQKTTSFIEFFKKKKISWKLALVFAMMVLLQREKGDMFISAIRKQ